MRNCEDPAKVGGMCGACYSWWNRARWMTATDFSAYLKRTEYRTARTVGRLSVANKVPHDRHRKAA